MRISIDCPLGNKCERATGDDTIVRCAWYIKIAGIDAQGIEHDEYGCAMAWMPILLLENARHIRSSAAGIESTRNEIVKRQDFLNNMLNQARNKQIE